MGAGPLPSLTPSLLYGLAFPFSLHSQLHFQRTVGVKMSVGFLFLFYFLCSPTCKSFAQVGLKCGIRRGLQYRRGRRGKVWSQPCRLKSLHTPHSSDLAYEFGLASVRLAHSSQLAAVEHSEASLKHKDSCSFSFSFYGFYLTFFALNCHPSMFFPHSSSCLDEGIPTLSALPQWIPN